MVSRRVRVDVEGHGVELVGGHVYSPVFEVRQSMRAVASLEQDPLLSPQIHSSMSKDRGLKAGNGAGRVLPMHR